MKKADLIDFLADYSGNEPYFVIEKGCHWFKQMLLPVLTEANKILLFENELLLESYLLTGEIYELIYAPKKALSFYKKAIEIVPNSFLAHQWMSALQEELGDYLSAMNHIELAITLAPDEESLMWDRQRIQDCIVYDKDPDISLEQPLYKYGQLLATLQFDIIIQALSKPLTTGFDELRCLAAAYAGKDELTDYLAIIEKMQTMEMDWEPEYFDSFYRPKEISYTSLTN